MSTSDLELRALARELGVALDARMAAQLSRLLEELALWNHAYNLTGNATREEMIGVHLLDSLAGSADLDGALIADLGTGAGFPGLPLAIAHPSRQFTLIDSTAKKIRFVEHAVRVLGLRNVQAWHGRAEAMRPGQAFDTVVARAVATLDELAVISRPLARAGTRLLAYKGRHPDVEIAQIPRDWELLEVRKVQVPRLAAERCLVTLVARGSAALDLAP